jgi:hypothetical protein
MRREGAASPKAARNTKHLKSVQLQGQDTRPSLELARTGSLPLNPTIITHGPKRAANTHAKAHR